MENLIKSVPEPTLKRLPQYIHLLKKLKEDGIRQISSNTIANELNLDSIQVRKDLAVTGVVGKPKLGFDLEELYSALLHTLNWDNSTDAFLVGMGSLGSAILGYKTFPEYGLNIIAAFDNDEEKIGQSFAGTEVLSSDKLTDMIKRMHINIGVITVPANEAQKVAQQMIDGGIIAIWNYAPVHLKVPPEIIVVNAQLSQSLGVLTHKLAERLRYLNL